MPRRGIAARDSTHCLDVHERVGVISGYLCTLYVEHEGVHIGGYWESYQHDPRNEAGVTTWTVDEDHPLWTGEGDNYVLQPEGPRVQSIKKAPRANDRRTTKAGLLP